MTLQHLHSGMSASVQKTGVFEHPHHASLASFCQVFNNHVQQWQPFNNGIKGLLNTWVISSFGLELLRVQAPCPTPTVCQRTIKRVLFRGKRPRNKSSRRVTALTYLWAVLGHHRVNFAG